MTEEEEVESVCEAAAAAGGRGLLLCCLTRENGHQRERRWCWWRGGGCTTADANADANNGDDIGTDLLVAETRAELVTRIVAAALISRERRARSGAERARRRAKRTRVFFCGRRSQDATACVAASGNEKSDSHFFSLSREIDRAHRSDFQKKKRSSKTALASVPRWAPRPPLPRTA